MSGVKTVPDFGYAIVIIQLVVFFSCGSPSRSSAARSAKNGPRLP